MSDGGEFANLISDVAQRLWGQPNQSLSSKESVKYGTHGARSISISKGTWFDHETKSGGGTLDLICREVGGNHSDAVRWLEEQGLFKPSQSPSHKQDNQKKEIECTYDYTDEYGELKYQVVRFKNPKTFLQRRPDNTEKSGWSWSVKGMTLYPYNLPEITVALASERPIFIVEGEKDVENLAELYIPATCNSGGAGKWPENFNQYFKGANVIIIQDNDEAGIAHRDLVGASLSKVASSVRFLDLKRDWHDMPERADVSDWIKNYGGTAERLYDLVETVAQTWKPAPPQSKFGALQWSDLDLPGQEHEWLIDDLLTRHDISLVYGPSKSGKSFLAIDMALSVARGEQFLSYKTRKGGVIYQAGEGSRGVKKRLRAYRQHHEVDTSDNIPFVLLTNKVDLYHADGDTDELIKEIKLWASSMSEPLELVVIDTLSTATPGADENAARDMSMVLTHAKRISDECKCHVMLVHHMNANADKPRGHTSLFANIDNALEVKRDEVSGIRTAKTSKQKDSEDDISFRFELKSVHLGERADGKAITSCVIMPVGSKTSDTAPMGARIKLTPQAEIIYRQLVDTINDLGMPKPENIRGPYGVKVVEYRHWRDAYARIASDDIDDEAKRNEAIRKAMQRAGEMLLKNGMIGRDHNYVWATGKRYQQDNAQMEFRNQ